MIFQEKMVLNESTIPDLLSGPVNIKWEKGAPAPLTSAGHTAVLYNGVIYVGGGEYINSNGDYKINIYHPDTNEWDDCIDTPHKSFTMTVLGDKLIVVGGQIGRRSKATNKLLTLQGGQWEDYSQMPTARWSASAVSHQSMMIVMGGKDDDYQILSTTELLYSTTGQWVKCNDLPQPLYFLQSVIVGDMLYTIGGRIGDHKDSKAVYAAPLHSLSNHQLEWEQLADTPWKGSAAVSVNNKYLLAVGGDGVHDTVCVLKNERAGSMITFTSWESIGTLPKVHGLTSAVSVGNQIIVIGGTKEEGYKHDTVNIGTFQ